MTEYQEKFTAWPALIGGIVLAAIGLICLLAPGLAYTTVGLMIGVAFIFAAAACFVTRFMMPNLMWSSYMTLLIVLDLVLGILFCVFPAWSTRMAVILVFAALLIFGVTNLVLQARDANGTTPRHNLESVGAIVLGIVIMIFPNLLIYAFALVALVEGVVMIVAALQNPRELVG